MTSIQNPADDSQSEYPRAWKWSEDGNDLAGTYAGMDSASTAYGPCGIVLLDRDNGERVALWLLQTALRSKFADELERRPDDDFTIGERITVRRGAERESASGRTYRAFTVTFPDAAKPDARTILGLGTTPSSAPELVPDPPPVDDDTDPIPF
jgi:hypothetical protein